MRIGIWCDYGFTLEPSEGIGVFVDNLSRGLVKADKECRVLLKSHPGEESVLASTLAAGQNRISVASGVQLSRFRRRTIRGAKKLRRLLQRSSSTGLLQRVDSAVARLILRLDSTRAAAIEEIIESCDVWLLPYVGLEQDFGKPTVVAIHDLVSYHFPSMLSPVRLQALKELVDRVSTRATIAACMSEFIREHDLIGTLDLPPSRIRVVKPAVPQEVSSFDGSCPAVNDPEIRALEEQLHMPFLFYPAAFRDYKNHRFLINSLKQMREQNRKGLKLVFTGIHRCPPYLLQLIERSELTGDVLILGKVSRQCLAWLYRKAFATVVPSLYEQGSFPLLEALHYGCPAVASDIPSLREQFRAMGDRMLYVDPHSPASLISITEYIREHRDDVIRAQREGFECLRQYTWEEAARQWLDVFREAIDLDVPIGRLKDRKSA